MADSKISDLSAVTTLDGTEEFVLADTGTTKKIGADDLATGIGGLVGVWQTYTPALTASSSNPTLGSGSVQIGYWTQIGKLAIVHVEIRFGSSGTAAGSGEYLVSVPFTHAASTPLFSGAGVIFDASASDSYAVNLERVSGGTTVKLWISQTVSAGVATHASPFAWAASDGIFFSGTFVVA